MQITSSQAAPIASIFYDFYAVKFSEERKKVESYFSEKFTPDLVKDSNILIGKMRTHDVCQINNEVCDKILAVITGKLNKCPSGERRVLILESEAKKSLLDECFHGYIRETYTYEFNKEYSIIKMCKAVDSKPYKSFHAIYKAPTSISDVIYKSWDVNDSESDSSKSSK